MFLYSLLLTVALVLSAPWWLFRMAATQRYREGLRERLGHVPGRIRTLLAGKRTVWLHAVSVGEVLAASSLIGELEKSLDSGWQIVISTTTRTGQQLAQQRFGADRVFYFPLDFRFAVRRWLRVLRPELVLLAESELWPRMLGECGAAGIPVAVVNARISDRSFRRALRLKALWRRMSRHVTLWLAQSEQDAARLRQLGAPAERIHTTGNLKYDTRSPAETPLTAAIRRCTEGRQIVLAGSTVSYGTTPEEGIVLEAMQAHVWSGWPDVLLILAPRHPERFTEAAVLAAHFGTTLRATNLLEDCSDGTFPQGATPEQIEERILVLDTIGDLAALYRDADVAFVGGSLLPHGGHNPLEPAQFGVPVIVGPHIANFRDIIGRLQAAEGIIVLADTEPTALGQSLAGLLADPAHTKALGERGRAIFERQKGATGRTLALLLPLLGFTTGRGHATDGTPDSPAVTGMPAERHNPKTYEETAALR